MKIYATRNTVAAAVMFTALSGIAGIGNANLSEITVESVRVSYADLNLGNVAGAETLYARLKRAAQKVCDDEARKPVNTLNAIRDCEETALNRAVEAVGSERLTDIHQS